MKKKYLLAFFAGWWLSGTLANFVITRQDERYNNLRKWADLNFEVIKRFAAYAPDEVSSRIKDEMEFDFIVLHLDDVDASDRS